MDAHTLIKCVRAGRTHRGYTYTLGRNVCPEPWNDGLCMGGGLYACELRHIFHWMNLYHDTAEIAWVSVPVEAGRYVFGDKVKASMLDVASFMPLDEAVKCALAAGADVHALGDAALYWAANNGHTVIYQILLDAGADKDMVLRVAAEEGNVPVAELMLTSGANVHAQDDLALTLAAKWGRSAAVSLLLQAGADVRASRGEALVSAASRGYTDVVELLLEAGADVHAQDDEALHLAARGRCIHTVELLLDRGASVHARGDLALQVAVESGAMLVVRMLLEYSADSRTVVPTPYARADVIKLIQEHQQTYV